MALQIRHAADGDVGRWRHDGLGVPYRLGLYLTVRNCCSNTAAFSVVLLSKARSPQRNRTTTHKNKAMNIQILDPQWLTDHDSQICAWSPFMVLWSIHHEITIAARTPLALYRSIEPNSGFTNDVQQKLITDIIQHYSLVAAFVDHFFQIYDAYNMSSPAHDDGLADAGAEAAARMLIYKLQALLDERLPELIRLSQVLAHGTYGFTSTLQQALLTTAATHVEHLTTMQVLFTRWTQLNQTPG
jgi:hypothetical protein